MVAVTPGRSGRWRRAQRGRGRVPGKDAVSFQAPCCPPTSAPLSAASAQWSTRPRQRQPLPLPPFWPSLPMSGQGQCPETGMWVTSRNLHEVCASSCQCGANRSALWDHPAVWMLPCSALQSDRAPCAHGFLEGLCLPTSLPGLPLPPALQSAYAQPLHSSCCRSRGQQLSAPGQDSLLPDHGHPPEGRTPG